MPRYTVGGIFQFEIIEPKLLSVARVKGKILAALEAEKKEALRMMNMTIENWHNPPRMYGFQRYAGGDVQVIVIPEGTGLQVGKWNSLDKGFDRYVKMKPRPYFIRKTHPRRLTTNPGTMPSTKGIAGDVMLPIHVQARQWSSIINRRMKARLAKNLQRAINEGLQ